MTEKPRETQAESHVVELKEKVNNSSLMKHQSSRLLQRRDGGERRPLIIASPARLKSPSAGGLGYFLSYHSLVFSRHSRTNRWASATCEPVITFSLSPFAHWITSGEYSSGSLAVAKLNHLWAWT